MISLNGHCTSNEPQFLLLLLLLLLLFSTIQIIPSFVSVPPTSIQKTTRVYKNNLGVCKFDVSLYHCYFHTHRPFTALLGAPPYEQDEKNIYKKFYVHSQLDGIYFGWRKLSFVNDKLSSKVLRFGHGFNFKTNGIEQCQRICLRMPCIVCSVAPTKSHQHGNLSNINECANSNYRHV